MFTVFVSACSRILGHCSSPACLLCVCWTWAGKGGENGFWRTTRRPQFALTAQTCHKIAQNLACYVGHLCIHLHPALPSPLSLAPSFAHLDTLMSTRTICLLRWPFLPSCPQRPSPSHHQQYRLLLSAVILFLAANRRHTRTSPLAGEKDAKKKKTYTDTRIQLAPMNEYKWSCS